MVELEGWLKKGIDEALKSYEIPEWRKKMLEDYLES